MWNVESTDLLSPYRYKKEFFCVTVEQARDAVEKAAIEVTGIESWRDGQVVHLRNRDKFVLALTAGEVLSISDIGPSTISCRTRPR